MGTIKEIRKSIKKHNDSIYSGDMEDTEELILEESYKNKAELVHTDTVDTGDRWLIDEVSVYKIIENGITAYFKITKSEGRTEMQSDGGIEVAEVIPKQVTITEYENI
jgi:hypothetical protein